MKFRIHLWLAAGVDMACAFISIVTFTFYRPWWDMRYRCSYSIKQLKRSMGNNG